MIPMTVEVAGWTGTEPELTIPQLRRLAFEQLEADRPGFRARYDAEEGGATRTFTDKVMELLHGYFIAKAHATLAPRANEFAHLNQLAAAAMAQADEEYASLSRNTTVNWLAAHHRFTTATLAAKGFLESCIEVATELLERRESTSFLTGELNVSIYERYVPAQDRIVLPDVDKLRVRLAAWMEKSTERFEVTRVTVTGGFPAGFVPAPVESAPAGVEQAWLGDDWSASVAVANTARRW